MRLLKLAVAIGMALALAAPARAQDGKGEPFELVRSLQSLQDQVARGNSRAHSHQRVLMARIAEQFAAMHPERWAERWPQRWKEPRNARAALVFVLSGGSARVLQILLASGASLDIDERLLKGALAYAEGRPDEAGQLLGGIEARTLEPSIAGHVAFVQAELVAQNEPARALAFLDDARLLSPGTLIEEAALRRQIALIAAAGHADRYEALAAQYLRRFPHSVYAGSFRQQFAVAIAANASVGEPGRLARLEAMLGGVGPAERRDIYLTIAKEALVKGKVAVARFAAANAARLTEGDSAERARSRVYEGAALVVTEELPKGVEILNGVARSTLAGADVALLDAALAVAVQVRRLPPARESAPAVGDQTAEGGRGVAGQIVERAQKTIAQVDQMLSGANQ